MSGENVALEAISNLSHMIYTSARDTKGHQSSAESDEDPVVRKVADMVN
jgi:hypothetical protein